MKLYLNTLVILMLSIALSCSDEIDKVRIERNGFLTFNVDGVEWRATSFKVTEGPFTIVYIDNPEAGRLFNRYSLIGQGINPEGLNFQLSLIFDIKTKNKFLGTYSPQYTIDGGGLNQIILNQETSNNSGLYSDYTSSVATGPSTQMNIKRQSEEEKLVLGSFSGEITLTGNVTKTLTISKGIFEDISYDQNLHL